jgi:hypothetical protein
VTEVALAPSREDEHYNIHGAHIPIEFARYKPMSLNIGNYVYRYAGRWRVAILRSLGPARANQLIARILAHGPQAAGYVRMGDTLVPDSMSASDRAALSSSARAAY